LRANIANALASFTLFATHYFELTTLATGGRGLRHVHLDATEHGDGHRLSACGEGGTGKSQLPACRSRSWPCAGNEVIAQARHYLEALEAERDTRNVMRTSDHASRQMSCRSSHRCRAIP